MLIIFTVLTIIGCNNADNSEVDLDSRENKEYTGAVSGLDGRVFLQPIDKKLSLALAPHTYITINMLDSIYCNIQYSGHKSLIAERKYSIDNDGNFKIWTPLDGKIKIYRLYVEKGNMYLFNKDNVKLFKVLSLDSLNEYLHSENGFRKRAFLYPSLNEIEQQFGAEDRYVEDNGLLQTIKHPLKSDIRKLNIYDLF